MNRIKKNLPAIVIALACLFFAGPEQTAFAFTYTMTIDDGYIGANPTADKYDGVDRIGQEDYFEISKMDVTYGEETLTVDIYTTYLDNIGELDTEFGDLFISSDGWNPYAAPSESDPIQYLYDQASNGEKWEYALVMDEHLPQGSSGDVYLYSTVDGIIKESWANAGYIYRADQEAQYNPGTNQEALATGSWEIFSQYIRFSIAYDFGLKYMDEMGFHYTFSCGNDVIEGKYTHTPEPATMVLLGSGLLGLSGFANRIRGNKHFK